MLLSLRSSWLTQIVFRYRIIFESIVTAYNIDIEFDLGVPYLTSLDMSSTHISLVKGLELLYPFRYKNMTKIDLSDMKTPRSNSISILYAVTIDVEFFSW
jgi:hypothetical protein